MGGDESLWRYSSHYMPKKMLIRTVTPLTYQLNGTEIAVFL